MKKIPWLFAISIAVFLFSCNTTSHDIVWTFMLEQPGRPPKEIVALPADLSGNFSIVKEVDGITVSIETAPKNGYTSLKATASSAKDGAACFISIAIQSPGIMTVK